MPDGRGDVLRPSSRGPFKVSRQTPERKKRARFYVALKHKPIWKKQNLFFESLNKCVFRVSGQLEALERRDRHHFCPIIIIERLSDDDSERTSTRPCEGAARRDRRRRRRRRRRRWHAGPLGVVSIARVLLIIIFIIIIINIIIDG